MLDGLDGAAVIHRIKGFLHTPGEARLVIRREELFGASLANPARPYPIRLISFSLFTLPSARPLF
jgi:hypothetical protein